MVFAQLVRKLGSGAGDRQVYSVNVDGFFDVPDAPFCYWVPEPIKNIYVNGTVPLFIYNWNVDASEILNKQCHPSTCLYSGYVFYLDVAVDVGVTFDDIVDKKVSAEIVPPAEVRSVGGNEVWDRENPFFSDDDFEITVNPDGTRWAYNGVFGVDCDSSGRGLRFSVAGIATIVQGWWEIRVDGEVIASFDLGVSSPFDADGNPRVYLPSLQAVVDESTGLVSAFMTAWYVYDSVDSMYQVLDDFTNLAKYTEWVGLAWDDQAGNCDVSDQVGAEPTTISPDTPLYFFGTAGQSPDSTLSFTGIRMGYRIYGVDVGIAVRSDVYDTEQ